MPSRNTLRGSHSLLGFCSALPAPKRSRQCNQELSRRPGGCPGWPGAMGATRAKDLCLKRDHQCRGRRADRGARIDDTGIEGALRSCASAWGRARLAASVGAGTPGRDTCIDQQVVAFQCRDAVMRWGGLLRHRSGFKTCARACGPVDPLDPPVDTTQCRLDAKIALQAAKAICVEDFRLAMSACINRDHGCVEICRGARHDCTGPIFDTLELAKDACRATRDLEFTNCRNLYAEGTPERDACIDQAQVVAFVCRDGAREIARPQLQACRLSFRGCVQICPAPAPPP